MMMAQMSMLRWSMKSQISRSAFCSRSITSASRFDSGSEKSMCGHDTRGQSNFANKSVLRGSVFVAHRVTAATVKSPAEMQHLRAALAMAGSHVLANLPIHRRLQTILDCQRTALDEKITIQRG